MLRQGSFLYAIRQQSKISEQELPNRPLEVLDHLKAILGEGGFRMIEPLIKKEIEIKFNSVGNGLPIRILIERIRDSFLEVSES